MTTAGALTPRLGGSPSNGGGPLRRYKSREALVSRLESLGAEVIKGGGSRHSKREVTLIVIPEGMEAGAVSRSACPNAQIVPESFVVKRAMALRSGTLTPAAPSPQPDRSKRARGAAAPAPASRGGEKRAARYRSMSAAAAARLERAMSERLYLIDRRDASEVSPSGVVALRAEFAILGSTGNVCVNCRQTLVLRDGIRLRGAAPFGRERRAPSPHPLVNEPPEFISCRGRFSVAICRTPSCDCVDFVQRKNVCKHLLFVHCKVLGQSRDSDLALQRGLLRAELAQLLTPSADAHPAAGAAAATAAATASATASAVEPPQASAAVRRAYLEAHGELGAARQDTAEAEAGLVAPRRPEARRRALNEDDGHFETGASAGCLADGHTLRRRARPRSRA